VVGGGGAGKTGRDLVWTQTRFKGESVRIIARCCRTAYTVVFLANRVFDFRYQLVDLLTANLGSLLP